MATGPRLVNKQFNSPIGLYSQRNIQDTLTKQTQVLNNGAVGIDFNNPINSKPSNLANSAVLRMLEEEEQRQRNGQPGRYNRSERDCDPRMRRTDRFIDWPPKTRANGSQISQNNAYTSKFFVPPNSGVKRIAWPPPEDSEGQQPGQEAPVQRQFVEPPPATITLRESPPVHQLPPTILASQPATNTFRGGVNMRGDQKWPPQTVKEGMEAENEARVMLAKGPACRPRKVKKDYSQFFAKNALPHNYAGYKVPPGTQHFEDFTGQSQF